MKIVDLQTLRSMPVGTVFQKTAPYYLEAVEIFEGPVGDLDFCSTHMDSLLDLFTLDALHDTATPQSISFDHVTRDATHNPDQLFAVWEPDDVRALIVQLRRALPDGEPT